jgi:hypothetical protein
MRDSTIVALAAALVIAFAAVVNPSSSGFAQTADDGVVRVKSAHGVEETVKILERDIAAKGIKFFGEIDQAKLAAEAGIQLRASILLTFGNPPLGIQFLTADLMPASIGRSACWFSKMPPAKSGSPTPTLPISRDAITSPTGPISF